jgi:branched-chain amino acid transport system substrate-binding protein
MPDLKALAQLEPNDKTGWSPNRLLKQHYEEAGYKVVSSELFERSLKEFQPVLTRILATKPDIIELGTTPKGGQPT